MSSEANKALQKSLDLSRKMGDQFVSVEHILMGLLESGDTISSLLSYNFV